MNMIGIKCPHCGADLKINDEIDVFYCNFCGGQIFMDGLSDAAYESRTKIKGMKHEEVMLDKKHEHEKYNDREKLKSLLRDLGILVAVIIIIIVYFGITSSKNEKEYKRIVTEVQQDISNGDFDSAYVTAQELVYPDSSEKEKKKKWDNTRRELINQIIEAEKAATGSSTHKPEKNGLFD